MEHVHVIIKLWLTGLLVVAAAGCSASDSKSDPATTVAPATVAAATSVAADPVIAFRGGCQPASEPDPARCVDLAPGRYETSGMSAFLPGLQLTLPAGYSTSEQDNGEFELHPAGADGDYPQLFFWRDLVVAREVYGNPEGTSRRSAAELVRDLRSDARFETSEPTRVVLGRGIAATQLDLRVAPGAVNEDPECPETLVCVAVFHDPEHWFDGTAWAIGRRAAASSLTICPCTQHVRLFIADVATAPTVTTFVVALVATDIRPVEALASWQAAVQPILDSISAPLTIVDN